MGSAGAGGYGDLWFWVEAGTVVGGREAHTRQVIVEFMGVVYGEQTLWGYQKTELYGSKWRWVYGGKGGEIGVR